MTDTIERNTQAFQSYNQRWQDNKVSEVNEKKKEIDLIEKVLILTEKASVMIDNQKESERRLIDQIRLENKILLDEVRKIAKQ